MYSMLRTSVRSTGLQGSVKASSRKWLHNSTSRHAITSFTMPAMSPTMTEGGISSWKKKEGETFATGDILLEIETDKATIDVEAQDDGIMGKILAPDGTKNIPVGKVIALLAEEGDDISNLEAPKESASESSPPKEDSSARQAESTQQSPQNTHTPSPPSSSTPKPSHNIHDIQHERPLFPSVLRLLIENDITDAGKIKGTGVRGMLTKGDVLAYLGKASSPTGTYREEKRPITEVPKKVVKEPLDAPAIRKLIMSGLAQAANRKQLAGKKAPSIPLSFDSIISDYLPTKPSNPAANFMTPPPPKTASSTKDYFDGLI